jgi:type VI protein secretion system component Hcp
VIRQVKIGSKSSAIGGQNGPTTQFELTRLTDGLSAKLLKATTEGTDFSLAKIQVYKPGTKVVAKTFQLGHASIIWFKAGQGQNKPTDELAIAAIPSKKAS